MKLYVKFEEDTVFDVLTQRMVDPGTIRLGRGSRIIPFAEHISIRKLKPREKLSQRVGDQWISSRKVSLAYLVAYYMLKNKKAVLAGFFDRGDGKYIFIEIKAGNMTMEARYMPGVDSSPRNFMAMSGRQYDGIFGDVSLSSEPNYINIPYEKLLGEVAIGVTPFRAAVVLAIAALAAGFFLFYSGSFTEKKIKQHTGTGVKRVIPPLTGDEVRVLSILITREALVQYKLYIDMLPEDIALRSATFHIPPVSNRAGKEAAMQELKGVLSFQFESFYPFRGSRKSGDYFVFEKEIVFIKRRDDVQRATRVEVMARQNKKGFETLIELCDVKARGDQEWKFSMVEKDYKNVVKIFNDIYLSPVVINRITVGDGKTFGELTFYRL